MADDVAREVVDDDQREGVGAVDVALHEVEVPQVIRARRLVALVVHLALHLRRAIPRLLHHPAHRVDARPDALAAELVPDLARPETRVAVPLVEDLLVALRLDLHRRGPRRRRRTVALRGVGDLPLPAVDRVAAHTELLARFGDPVRGSVLEDLGLLRGRVDLRHPGLERPAHRRLPRRRHRLLPPRSAADGSFGSPSDCAVVTGSSRFGSSTNGPLGSRSRRPPSFDLRAAVAFALGADDAEGSTSRRTPAAFAQSSRRSAGRHASSPPR